MRFEEWEPYYEQIADELGIDREKDEEAARVLASLAPRDDLPALAVLCEGRTVTVCGNAPCLKRELPLVQGTVFAADAATDTLAERGMWIDAVFTDLDGATDLFPELNRRGTVMVVHAHGDNIPLLRHWVPRFHGPFVATTQGRPFDGVHNFGGFTDGDRAVFSAHALGAEEVVLTGFDLDDPHVDHYKRGKLAIARRLLALLGHEC